MLVVFFSIPSGKRDVYILPALPMFCLALAPLLPGLLRRRPGVRRLLFGFAAALSLAFAGAGLAMLLGHPGFEQRLMDGRGVGSDVTAGLAWIALAAAAWGIGGLLLWRVRRAEYGVASLLAGFWVLYGLVAYPLLNDASSARGVMRSAGARIGQDAELGLVAWKEQNLLMADRPARTFGFKVPWDEQLRRGVAWQAQHPQRRWLLVQEAALLDCIDRGRIGRAGISNRRSWWLVPAGAVVGDCRTALAAGDELLRRQYGEDDE